MNNNKETLDAINELKSMKQVQGNFNMKRAKK